MKPSPPSQPDWKSVILAGPDWPKDFVVPQADIPPKGSETVLESFYGSENWEWELWRQPDGKRYFLKIWPFNEGKFSNPKTPGVALSVTEAFQFLMTNWMPRVIYQDMEAICPEFAKGNLPPPDRSSRN
jgi:hypothetical protein